MAIDIGEIRKLKFPLDNSIVLYTDTPNEPIEDTVLNWQTVDSNERVIITLELSLNEYVGLASCVDVGSDIAFGSEAIRLWQIWVRSVNAMPFCEQTNLCITTSPSTINAINNTALSSGVINPDIIDPVPPLMDNRFPPLERQNSVRQPPPSCDNDALWAGILEMVVRLDQLTRDYYETCVANVDKVERIISIVDLVPILGDTIADVIKIFADILPDLTNAYNAHSSQAVLEDTACKLFELVCDECRYPTFEEVYDHYANLGVVGMQDIASYGVQAAIDYVIGTNGLANALVWYTSQIFTLYTMYLGGTFLNVRGTKWLGIWANIGEDNPNNGWELLCDGCTPAWCYNFAFAAGIQGWSTMAEYGRDFGVYVNPVWESVWGSVNGDFGERLYIDWTFDNVTDVTQIRVKGSVVGTYGANSSITAVLENGGTVVYNVVKFLTETGEIEWVWDRSAGNADKIRIVIACSAANSTSLDVKISDIQISGASPVNANTLGNNC